MELIKALSERMSSSLAKQYPAFYEGVIKDQQDGLCFFAVDNTQGVHGDATVLRLAHAIDKATDALPTMRKKVPANWLRVFDRLHQTGKETVPLKDALAITRECGFPSAPSLSITSEVDYMLSFFHSLGAVLWFKQPGLRETIVLDPQWVIDGVTCVVREFPIHKMEVDEFLMRGQFESQWRELTTHARLDRMLLPYLWREHVDDAGKPRFGDKQALLLGLMVRFGLAVEVLDKELLLPPLFCRITDKVNADPSSEGDLSFVVHMQMVHMQMAPERSDKILWPIADLKAGFLPADAFHQLCAAAMGVCPVGVKPRVGEDVAQLWFGRHKYALEKRADEPIIDVKLYSNGSDGAGVVALRRIHMLLEKALRHYPNLKATILLPVDSLLYVSHDPTERLDQDTFWTEDYMVHPESGAELPKERRRELLKPWVEDAQATLHWDAMISYRHNEQDSAIVGNLFDCLSAKDLNGRPLRIFQDAKRLKGGNDFVTEFLEAICRSTVIVPIVSLAALAKMRTLTPESEVDWVLLEWVLAIYLHESESKTSIRPVFVGATEYGADGRATLTSFFSSADETPGATSTSSSGGGQSHPLHELPSVVVRKVYDHLDEFLAKKKMAPWRDVMPAGRDRLTVKDSVLCIKDRFFGIEMSTLCPQGEGALAEYGTLRRDEKAAIEIFRTIQESKRPRFSPAEQKLQALGDCCTGILTPTCSAHTCLNPVEPTPCSARPILTLGLTLG